MPGGFLKKLGTASCGITGMLVAVALLCADTGRESGANIRDSAPTIATRVSENVRHRFIAATSRTRPGPAPNERPIIAPDHGATEAQSRQRRIGDFVSVSSVSPWPTSSLSDVSTRRWAGYDRR